MLVLPLLMNPHWPHNISEWLVLGSVYTGLNLVSWGFYPAQLHLLKCFNPRWTVVNSKKHYQREKAMPTYTIQ